MTALLRKPSQPPRLLVSVRSVDEARRAIAGGVDVLDIKEPARGSLGMADMEAVSQIARAVTAASGSVPLSVALGEVIDWLPSLSVPVFPAAVSFAKLGLSRCAFRSDWRTVWQELRARFNQQQSSSSLQWVAVAYADADNAESPEMFEVLDEAIQSECAGFLIDTWKKEGLTLVDTIDVATLTKVAHDCHAAGMFLAIAGHLRRASLPFLAHVATDIIAIRSAACTNSERTSEIDRNLVAEFRRELRRCFELQPTRPE